MTDETNKDKLISLDPASDLEGYKQLFIDHGVITDLIIERINKVGSNGFTVTDKSILSRRLKVAGKEMMSLLMEKELNYTKDDVLRLYGYIEGYNRAVNDIEKTRNYIKNTIVFKAWSLVSNKFIGTLLGDSIVSATVEAGLQDIPEGEYAETSLKLIDDKFYLVGPFVEKRIKLVK